MRNIPDIIIEELDEEKIIWEKNMEIAELKRTISNLENEREDNIYIIDHNRKFILILLSIIMLIQIFLIKIMPEYVNPLKVETIIEIGEENIRLQNEIEFQKDYIQKLEDELKK